MSSLTRLNIGCQSTTAPRTSAKIWVNSSTKAFCSEALTMRSHSTKIRDSTASLRPAAWAAATVLTVSILPSALRATLIKGWTIQCAVRPLRLIAIVTESTRKGILSFTICTTVCSLTKPSSAKLGLNTRIFGLFAARGESNKRQCAFAKANKFAAPRVVISSGSVFSK